jgi:hypothetical protein
MADWASLVGAVNEQVLAAFGREITYTPAVGDPFTVAGILEAGARPEGAAPGVYALLFVRAAAFAQPPARGDEVTVGGSVYKVVDLEADAEGGLRLVLHFNRAV